MGPNFLFLQSRKDRPSVRLNTRLKQAMADTQCGFGPFGLTTAPTLALHWSQTKENTEGVCRLLLTSADAIFDPLFSVASPCLSTPSRLSSSPLPSSRGGSQQQVKDRDPPHKDRLPIPSGGESSAPASRKTRGGWMGWKRGGYLSTC